MLLTHTHHQLALSNTQQMYNHSLVETFRTDHESLKNSQFFLCLKTQSESLHEGSVIPSLEPHPNDLWDNRTFRAKLLLPWSNLTSPWKTKQQAEKLATKALGLCCRLKDPHRDHLTLGESYLIITHPTCTGVYRWTLLRLTLIMALMSTCHDWASFEGKLKLIWPGVQTLLWLMAS